MFSDQPRLNYVRHQTRWIRSCVAWTWLMVVLRFTPHAAQTTSISSAVPQLVRNLLLCFGGGYVTVVSSAPMQIGDPRARRRMCSQLCVWSGCVSMIGIWYHGY